MNPSFNIITPNIDTTDCSLLVEISGHGVSFIVINPDNHCTALSVYHFDGGTTHDKVANYLKDIAASQPILQQQFKKINFVYAFAASILVPHQFINETANKGMLELVYGDISEGIMRNDIINQQDLQNIYLVPKQVDWVIANLFAQANYNHLYSLLTAINKAMGNHLYCIFSTTQITMQLLKEGQLQVIQSFDFKEPADAIYHLLNVCERFEVNINETVVHFNGMIDADSNLYHELYKYLLHPTFERLPNTFTYDEEIKRYPAHYFSHLFVLATCV